MLEIATLRGTVQEYVVLSGIEEVLGLDPATWKETVQQDVVVSDIEVLALDAATKADAYAGVGSVLSPHVYLVESGPELRHSNRHAAHGADCRTRFSLETKRSVFLVLDKYNLSCRS